MSYGKQVERRCPQCGGSALVWTKDTTGIMCMPCGHTYMPAATEYTYQQFLKTAQHASTMLGNVAHFNRGELGDLCLEAHDLLAKALPGFE